MSLADRPAAASVITEFLRAQAQAPRHGPVARIFGRSPLSVDSRPWYKGSLGEIEVGHILQRLDERWTVLHAVPVGANNADIDHVLIGPGGVFTLNTKNHSGQRVFAGGGAFRVNGHATQHVRNSQHEAARAGRLLSAAVGRQVEATPVIVVVRAKHLTFGRDRPKVAAVASTQLLRWLQKRPMLLESADVAAIAHAAATPHVWRAGRAPDLVPGGDPSEERSRFSVLHSEVVQARRRARGWMLLAMAGAGAAAFGTLAALPDLLLALL
ncbi:MAG: hypothetical protein JWQ43_2116 [Glaciihabitans sp.]|nr:hypothetical protein [Glaciihabitans sp.]